jgi:hypothetical protein
MSRRRVYRAINAVAADLAEAGIAKTRSNEAEGYEYRSIDDVLNRLAPLKRAELKAISRLRNELYVAIGEAFASRRVALTDRSKGSSSVSAQVTKWPANARARLRVPELALA